jgi:aminoglycoside phosphotransferase (APT) family kinase protein
VEGIIDTDAVTPAWEAVLRAPEWDHAPVWFHGDLLPGNLLLQRGRLRAVIDFSGLGVGDPACDVTIAWGLFFGESREVFRAELAVDDALAGYEKSILTNKVVGVLDLGLLTVLLVAG